MAAEISTTALLEAAQTLRKLAASSRAAGDIRLHRCFWDAAVCLTTMVGADRLGNRVRKEGADRCFCGGKYWENDRCIDCGATEPMPDRIEYEEVEK